MNARNLFFVIILFVSTKTFFAQPNIDVKHYAASIHFNLDQRTISGDAVLTFANTTGQVMNVIQLKLRDLIVTRAEENNSQVTFNQSGEDLTITLASPLELNAETNVRIIYNGSPTSEPGVNSWGGFFFGNPTFTMGVSFNTPYVSMTRHWLPSNDIPSDKATFDFTFIIPNGYAAAGTGVLQSIMPVGSDSVAYRWIENHQTATYLVTLAIGTYARIQNSWKGVPLEYFILKNDSAKAVTFFSTIPGMLECFTNAYGSYPFDKVGFCMTPIGAMEHQTMISYPQQFISFYQNAEVVAAHELSHQWWGDWVTPKDFREAWLSEGFATYSEALYDEYQRPNFGYWNTVRSFVSNYINQISRSEGIFPLYDFPRTSPSSNYPGTIYKKGGSVLAMLRHIIGDSVFFRGLRKYGQQFAYGNATTIDFRSAMETEFKSDLSWFFDEWVYKAGYPEYIVQKWTDNSSNPYRLRIVQNQDTQKYPLFTMPIDVGILTQNNDTLHFVITNKAIKMEDFTFPSVPANTVKNIIFDPKGVILKKVSYQTVGVKEHRVSMPPFQLMQNYPNPVSNRNGNNSHTTQISFTLDRAMNVRLDLFDSLGKKLKSLVSSEMPSGEHSYHLDATDLITGTYFYVLHSGSNSAVRKMIITN